VLLNFLSDSGVLRIFPSKSGSATYFSFEIRRAFETYIHLTTTYRNLLYFRSMRYIIRGATYFRNRVVLRIFLSESGVLRIFPSDSGCAAYFSFGLG